MADPCARKSGPEITLKDAVVLALLSSYYMNKRCINMNSRWGTTSTYVPPTLRQQPYCTEPRFGGPLFDGVWILPLSSQPRH